MLETVAMLGLGLGAALAPAALAVADLPGVLLAAGLLLAAVGAAAWRAVSVIDRGVVLPGPEVSLLRRLPIFAPLPLVTVEQLATRLGEARYEDGAVVLRKGEPGDLFHVIAEGAAVASVAGQPLRTMGPGDGFGEIALLRAVLRTATVVARGPLRTATLHRSDFLAALAVNLASATAADALAAGRLEAAHRPRRDPGRTSARGDLAGLPALSRRRFTVEPIRGSTLRLAGGQNPSGSWTPTTILPRVWPSSRYRMAAGTSSSG